MTALKQHLAFVIPDFEFAIDFRQGKDVPVRTDQASFIRAEVPPGAGKGKPFFQSVSIPDRHVRIIPAHENASVCRGNQVGGMRKRLDLFAGPAVSDRDRTFRSTPGPHDDLLAPFQEGAGACAFGDCRRIGRTAPVPQPGGSVIAGCQDGCPVRRRRGALHGTGAGRL